MFPPPLRNLSYPKQYVCTVMAVMTRNVLRLMMQSILKYRDYEATLHRSGFGFVWAKFAKVSRKDVQY
jgi:hypothetical protein